MFLWLIGLTAHADVPSVDDPTLNIEEKNPLIYRVVIQDNHEVGSIFRLKDPIFHGMRWSKWGELSPFWELCTPLATGGAQASWGLVTAQVIRGDTPLENSVSLHRTNCPAGPNSCTADIHRPAYTELELLIDLQVDDEIVIVMGDETACFEQCTLTQSDCSRCNDCGFETPDRAFERVPLASEWCVNDICNQGPSAYIDISAQPQLKHIWLSPPSTVRPGSSFPLKVALLDYRGNPIPQLGAQISLVDQRLSVGAPIHRFVPSDGGWHDFEIQIETEGIHRVELEDAQGNRFTSPPIWVSSDHTHQLYWGDIHVHHGWTTWTEDGVRIDHNHRYGRDVMGLDVVSESIKARGIEINADGLWSELQDNCRQYSIDGDYLALLGFEWIGDPAAAANCGDNSCSQGHHNIYYSDCNGLLADLDPTIIDGLEGSKGLWTWLQQQDSDYTSIPHAMQFTRFDYEARDPAHQFIAEIYSEWGDNTINLTSAGSTAHMLSSGLRLGWIGGSDNHDGWMGNPESTKNTPSGLAAFWSTGLNHTEIFESITQKQTFATTGHRPILDFYLMDNAYKIPMGTAYFPANPAVHLRYHGTDTVEKVQLFSIAEHPNAERQLLWETTNPDLDTVETLYLDDRIDFTSPHGIAIWIEATQEDDEKAWSSPIWLSFSCNDSNMTDVLGLCDSQNTEYTDTASIRPPPAQSPKSSSRCQAVNPIPHIWLSLCSFFFMIRRRA
ncbi:MAG: DUF3604 domain-containing protein [Myxococcota bacterium]|nr:DUF3604 domain-containing protein [Myxococcota bacterium]